LILAVGAVLLVVITSGSDTHRPIVHRAQGPAARLAHSSTSATPAPRPAATATAPPARPRVARRITVGEALIRFVDPARTMVVSGRRVPRSFVAVARYPVGLRGPFPLVVFGHGFAVSPTPYSGLLSAWTKAAYVVLAPVFPLENALAPEGPNENDLPNQPADMSLVISGLSRPSSAAQARISALIDFRRIAVSGQSDGGDTALAAAYDPAVRDRRITAAVILSGAEDPFAPRFSMPPHGPPLLAIQGTADTINPPYQTYDFFHQASRPKFLLKLLGAGHQPPYTEPGTELSTVEHMTLAFLNRYLKGRSRAFPRYIAAGSAGPGSVLTSAP
jgi:dienelactone hydrolase